MTTASTEPPLPDAILVPMDFSPCAVRALDLALAWRPAGAEVIALHVVDTTLARRMERAGVSAHEPALAKMRERAGAAMRELVDRRGAGAFETMIADGVPFAEICKVANDLACGMIVMGKYGNGTQLKDLLFGGTAEKVVRGARQPVLCVP